MSDQHQEQTDLPVESGSLPPVGDLLRSAREYRGESLGDVAHALKLSPRQVEAIELERFDLLPGPAFVRGFMRNYARYVGIDIEERIAALKWGETSRTPQLATITNATGSMPTGSGERTVLKPALAIVGAMLVALVAGWYFDWFKVDEPNMASMPPAAEVDAPPSVSVAPPAFTPRPPLARSLPDPVDSAEAPALGSIDLAPDPAMVAGDGSSPGAATSDIPTPGSAMPGASTSDTPTPDAAAPAATSTPGVSTPGVSTPGVSTPGVSTPGVSTSDASAPEALAGAPDQPGQAGSAGPATDEAGEQQGETGATTGDTQPPAGRLVFSLRGESWIQVRDGDGTALFTGTAAAGTTRTVQGKAPFSIVVGNAGLVSLEHDGDPVDLAPHISASGVARMTIR